jgi:hypothetical protein
MRKLFLEVHGVFFLNSSFEDVVNIMIIRVFNGGSDHEFRLDVLLFPNYGVDCWIFLERRFRY